MFALTGVTQTHIVCGRYEIAEAYTKELVALAEEKRSSWKSFGVVYQGLLSALNGEAADAVQMIAAGVSALQSTGTTLFVPWFLAALARAYARLGRFDDAWGSFDKAIETLETGKETQWEAEVNRIGGEIALISSEPRVTKAEAYFDRALAVAREQQAKSWELRAAMSMARLWRDQGKPQQARQLLAPVYGWFTEGFDTRDLKEAKALLDALSS
jgi:predicted ATPase